MSSIQIHPINLKASDLSYNIFCLKNMQPNRTLRIYQASQLVSEVF